MLDTTFRKAFIYSSILFLFTSLQEVDKDVLICNNIEKARSIAGTFLTVFLNKCGSKNEDIDYRPLFENFVQDLLSTVNKPEWPATELLLSLLGCMLVGNFSNKGTDMSLRVVSLDYLGVVAARLRRDSVMSRCKLNTIDQMIKDIKNEESKTNDESSSKVRDGKILEYWENLLNSQQLVFLKSLWIQKSINANVSICLSFIFSQYFI